VSVSWIYCEWATGWEGVNWICCDLYNCRRGCVVDLLGVCVRVGVVWICLERITLRVGAI
jgi:hypothetical protein